MIAPRAELALLRAVVRTDADALRARLSDTTVDPGRFLRFAHRNQLGAYVYWTLQQLGLASLLPPPLLAAAKASALLTRIKNEKLARHLGDLGDLFDRAGTRVLFIKGPLFAERFYGSIDARGLADLDILIRAPGDLDGVEALLLRAGYEPAFRLPVGRALTQRFVHHFEYRREALPLDVHWALQAHFTFAIDYARVWQTAFRSTFGTRSFETTSDEYELVLQILGVLTDLQVGKLGLRSMVDIYRILKRVDAAMDWPGFFDWRARERILRPAVYALALALDVLDCHHEFAALHAALEPRRSSLPPTDPACRAVLASRPLALGQKLLALRIYETSLARSVGWWLVSLPVRLAVHGVTRRLPGP
jgi:hypothetical protein